MTAMTRTACLKSMLAIVASAAFVPTVPLASVSGDREWFPPVPV